MRSAPTLKIWMTPFASVAMLEKLALLKIALCSAPDLSSASSACLRAVMSVRTDMYLFVCPSSPVKVVMMLSTQYREPSLERLHTSPRQDCPELMLSHMSVQNARLCTRELTILWV